MIKSMTGYGKVEVEIKNSSYNIEIRTLNSKQMDINMRVPQAFKQKEIELRNLLGKQLQRGKIDFMISGTNHKQNSNIKINQVLVKNYYNELTAIAAELGEQTENILSIITRLPDVFIPLDEEMDASDWQEMLKAVHNAIDKVNRFRIEEGSILEEDFRIRVDKILKYLEQVPSHETARIERIRQRIQKSLEENFSNVQYDKNRLEQEIIFYIEKLDITEEKIRLKKHCDYFLEVLNSEDTVGKKLAFVTQEIGREINTLGSKANDASLQKLVVHMKDELEKIKEQMLNIL